MDSVSVSKDNDLEKDNNDGENTPSKRRSIEKILTQHLDSKKIKANLTTYLEENIYNIKTAADIGLIYCSLQEDENQDSWTHPLYLKVMEEENNYFKKKVYCM